MGNLKLRMISVLEDIDFLYNCIMDSDQYLFSVKIPCNTKQQFKKWLTEQMSSFFHDFYIIEYNKEKIGYVHNYEFSMKDGRCKIVVYVSHQYRHSGIGAIGAIMFMKYLFNNYPLRKIYIDIYDYNKESLESNIKAGFIEEGEIKEYRYYSGKLYSLHILSMDRNTFELKLGRKIK